MRFNGKLALVVAMLASLLLTRAAGIFLLNSHKNIMPPSSRISGRVVGVLLIIMKFLS